MIEALLNTTEVLPKGWRLVQLGDVLSDIIGGGTPSREVERYWNGDIPWITVKDMRTRRPEAIQEHITEAGVNECATNIIPADTVITATRVGLGKVVRVPYPAAINQDLKALIVGPDLDKDYLEWWIISQANHIESIGSGTTVKGIRLNQLKELQIPLAPLPQQRRIVEAIELQLGRLDAAVARLQGAKARLKRYKQAVLKAAVEGRLTEEWRDKNPDIESAERIVERIQERRATIERTSRKTKTSTPAELDLDSLPSLPEGWMWSTLPQLGELNRGKSKHRPRDDKRLYGGPYPFIQTGDVRYANGRLTEFTSTYSEFGLAQSRLWPAGTMGTLRFVARTLPDTAVP
ncbi:MAG: restriction endonuclease subunit S [Flavobacteriales bacterium]|nr:restriction endonuclease subunit S [Flavobacteriales bacterium]